MMQQIAQKIAAALLSVSVLMVAAGCASPTRPTGEFPTQPIGASPIGPVASRQGAIDGAVTINGEARAIAWVELQQGASSSRAWGDGTTNSSGKWAWERVPVGDYFVVIKTPPGLTCDATRKSAAVETDQRTVVNFACFGDLKGSILGIVMNEFGFAASLRITVTGLVNRETISNRDGFFTFEGLPPGEYLVGPCNTVRASVRDRVTAFATVDCS
jgi:hypothetical protein